MKTDGGTQGGLTGEQRIGTELAPTPTGAMMTQLRGGDGNSFPSTSHFLPVTL